MAFISLRNSKNPRRITKKTSGGLLMELHFSAGFAYCGLNMIPLLIAGGSIISTFTAPQLPEMMNHTLNATPVKAQEVVCRTRWGTPMMPDGKGSYNLTAAPNPIYIQRSLIQPPKTDAPIYRPGAPYILPSQAVSVESQPLLPK
jgi:hypothetical protein